jgi:hypothetical protein
LNERLRYVVGRLATNPQLSLPRVFDSAGLEATYRLLSNVSAAPNPSLEAWASMA